MGISAVKCFRNNRLFKAALPLALCLQMAPGRIHIRNLEQAGKVVEQIVKGAAAGKGIR